MAAMMGMPVSDGPEPSNALFARRLDALTASYFAAEQQDQRLAYMHSKQLLKPSRRSRFN